MDKDFLVVLRGGALMPVHWGMFSLANHGWFDPIRRIDSAARGKDVRLLTPRLGQGPGISGHMNRDAVDFHDLRRKGFVPDEVRTPPFFPGQHSLAA